MSDQGPAPREYRNLFGQAPKPSKTAENRQPLEVGQVVKHAAGGHKGILMQIYRGEMWSKGLVVLRKSCGEPATGCGVAEGPFASASEPGASTPSVPVSISSALSGSTWISCDVPTMAGRCWLEVLARAG